MTVPHKPLAMLSLVVLLLAACGRDYDTFTPVQQLPVDNSPSALIALLEVLEPASTLHSWPAGSEKQIEAQGQVVFTIPANALVKMDGAAVDGTVEARFFQLRTRGEWVGSYLSMVSSDNQLLDFRTVYHIELKQDGERLRLAPGASINIHWPASEANAAHRLFMGQPSSDLQVGDWTDSGAPEMGTVYDKESHVWRDVWRTQSTSTSWMGLGHLLAVSGGNANLKVALPPGYNGYNTMVYAILSSPSTVVALSAASVEGQYLFSTSRVPQGQNVELVTLTHLGGQQYQLANTQVNTGSTLVTVLLSPANADIADIKAKLSAL